MSLLKYFNNLGTPTKRKVTVEEQTSVTPKKMKLNDTVSEKNKKYDSQKRERKFQQHWLDTFTWLFFNKDMNMMFCNVCKEYPKLTSTNPGQQPVFVTGTDKFRIEAIRSHESSVPHRNCLSKFHHEKEANHIADHLVPLRETAIGKALMNINEKEMEKMRMLFNTAYTLAIYNKPFSDMEMMCELMMKNGLQLGDSYQNKTRAREFISMTSNKKSSQAPSCPF